MRSKTIKIGPHHTIRVYRVKGENAIHLAAKNDFLCQHCDSYLEYKYVKILIKALMDVGRKAGE